MSLRSKTKNALDEARILVLGTQVLLGFQFRVFFEPRFDAQPEGARRAALFGLFLLLAVMVALMLPAARHRVVERGRDTNAFFQFAQRCVGTGLPIFALALALDFWVALRRLGSTPAWIAGGAALLIPLALWDGLVVLRSGRPKQEEEGELKLSEKITQVLTETRVVLPGAQAVLGFQLLILMTEAFERMPPAAQRLHFVALGFVGLAIVLLMAPASFHRVVEHGEDTERFHRFASWMLIAAMVVLPPGFAADVAVVMHKQTHSMSAAWFAALGTVAVFYGVWFGLTLALRQRA